MNLPQITGFLLLLIGGYLTYLGKYEASGIFFVAGGVYGLRADLLDEGGR
jgi:hypothetical protein